MAKVDVRKSYDIIHCFQKWNEIPIFAFMSKNKDLFFAIIFSHTVYPQTVSAEKMFFWIWKPKGVHNAKGNST